MDLTKEQKMMKQSSELNELKRNQILATEGHDTIEYVEANRKTGCKIRALEQNYVHLQVLEKHLNADMKTFTENVSILKIHAREFDRRVKEGAFKTYDKVEIIHDPRVNASVKTSIWVQNLAEETKAEAEKIAKEAENTAKENTLRDIAKNLDERERELKIREEILKREELRLHQEAEAAKAEGDLPEVPQEKKSNKK